MIIQCKRLISSTTYEELGVSPWITKDKKYIVLGIIIALNDGISAIIQSDHYNRIILKKLDGFEIVSQKIPKNWEMQVSDNLFCYLTPRSWMYDEFFEELRDENPRAMELFRKEAEIMYREEEWL